MGLLRRLIRPLYEKSKLYTLNPSPRGLLCTQISTPIANSPICPPNPPILMLLANLTIGNYRQFWGTFEAPQPPTLGEHELQSPPELGDLGGRNNSDSGLCIHGSPKGEGL